MFLSHVGPGLRALPLLAGTMALLLCSQAMGQSSYKSGSIRYSGGYGSITSKSTKTLPKGQYGANVLGSPERAAYDASIRYGNEQRMARIKRLYNDDDSAGYGRLDTVTGRVGYSGYRNRGYGRIDTVTGTNNYSSPGGYGRIDTLNGSIRYHGDGYSRASASAGSIRYSQTRTLRTGGVGLPN